MQVIPENPNFSAEAKQAAMSFVSIGFEPDCWKVLNSESQKFGVTTPDEVTSWNSIVQNSKNHLENLIATKIDEVIINKRDPCEGSARRSSFDGAGGRFHDHRC